MSRADQTYTGLVSELGDLLGWYKRGQSHHPRVLRQEISSWLRSGKELHVYAGKEISRALALDSAKAEDIGSAQLHDLGEEAIQRLEGKLQEMTGVQKMAVVGQASEGDQGGAEDGNDWTGRWGVTILSAGLIAGYQGFHSAPAQRLRWCHLSPALVLALGDITPWGASLYTHPTSMPPPLARPLCRLFR